MISLDERELIENCISGDRRYQEILYRKYCRKMMGVCCRYMNDINDAEDLLQEAFIRVFTRLKQFEGKGSFEGWIRRIVLNTIFESLRKKKRMIQWTVLSHEHDVATEDTVMNRFSGEELLKILQELPAGCRTIFNMHAVDGYTHREIAAILRISEGTSKSQFHAARKMMMEKLKTAEEIIISK